MNKTLLLILVITTFFSCKTKQEFYANGTIKAQGRTSDHLKNGIWKIYYEDGNLFQQGAFAAGMQTGEWKIFHANGKIRQIGKFVHGKQNGEWIFFHSNGAQEGIGNLINGQKTGRWKWYFENGQLQTERIWNDGKLVEVVSHYDGNGKLLDKGTVVNGTGIMNVYNIDGELVDIIRYENGIFVE